MSVQVLVKPTVKTNINKSKKKARRRRLASKDRSLFRLISTAVIAFTILAYYAPFCYKYWPAMLVTSVLCVAFNLRKINWIQTTEAKFPLFWKAPNHTQLFFARVQHGFFRNRALPECPGFPYFRTRLQLEPFQSGFTWIIDDTPGDRAVAADLDGYRPVEFVFKRVS